MQKNAFLYSANIIIEVCKQYRTILFWKSITQSLLSNITKWVETNTIFSWYFSEKNTVFRENYYDDKFSQKWFWLPQKWI